MIHATIIGILPEDATFTPAFRDDARANIAVARFRLSTRRRNGAQIVDCELFGRTAAAVERHLIAGKRVVAMGELTLLTGGRFPRLVLDTKSVEFVGGTPSYHERVNEEDER